MLFAWIYYKLVIKNLIHDDAKGALGLAAFVEWMVELIIISSFLFRH